MEDQKERAIQNNKHVCKKGNVQEDSTREIVLSTGNKEYRVKQVKNKLR